MNKRSFFIQFVVLLPLLFSLSCGTQDDELKREAAIEKAYILMSSGNCREAVSVIEAAPSTDTDARFIKTRSIAYACRAGYSTVRLFAQDLEQFSVVGGGSFLNALARFSTSSLMTEVDSANFEDMQKAIDILLYAGGIATTRQPTAARRATLFNDEDAGEINAQLSYLILAQLGMYFRYFGNTDTTGIKGSGGSPNICLLSYSDDDAMAYFLASGPFGTCPKNGPYDDFGHPQLDADPRLACQGITLFNNLTDVLPAVVAAASSGLLQGDWITKIDDAKKAILLFAPGLTIFTEQNYSKCNTDHPNYDKELEVYFAGIFEGSLL